MSNSNFPNYRGTRANGVPRDVVPITPNDSTDIPDGPVFAIRCRGSAGNVVITTVAGNDRTYPIAADETIIVGVSRVKSTGTTATTLWGFIA